MSTTEVRYMAASEEDIEPRSVTYAEAVSRLCEGRTVVVQVNEVACIVIGIANPVCADKTAHINVPEYGDMSMANGLELVLAIQQGCMLTASVNAIAGFLPG